MHSQLNPKKDGRRDFHGHTKGNDARVDGRRTPGTPTELSEKELDQVAAGITLQQTTNVTEVK